VELFESQSNLVDLFVQGIKRVPEQELPGLLEHWDVLIFDGPDVQNKLPNAGDYCK
jgi:hypothetical protein